MHWGGKMPQGEKDDEHYAHLRQEQQRTKKTIQGRRYDVNVLALRERVALLLCYVAGLSLLLLI